MRFGVNRVFLHKLYWYKIIIKNLGIIVPRDPINKLENFESVILFYKMQLLGCNIVSSFISSGCELLISNLVVGSKTIPLLLILSTIIMFLITIVGVRLLLQSSKFTFRNQFTKPYPYKLK